MTHAKIRKCPVCLSPADAVQLGFRDYSIVNDALPGKVGMMDFDAVLERRGSVLIFEFKPKGVTIGRGQQLTYKTMVNKDCEVWLVQGDPSEATIVVAEMNHLGNWTKRRSLTPQDFAAEVVSWFESK